MQKLSDVFKELAKKNSMFRRLYVNMVAKNEFLNIIGKPFNEYCKVSRFSNGTVFIECDDNIYVTELNFFKEKIREELNKRIGFNAVNKILIKLRR
ncbi:MAG: DUF721 domain-containing protein [Thermosipho sp. (in: Bacteria)]|nr:DUF721 domain-containing protein [Thermosipho sp. (in: thermotogales)]